MGLMLPWLSSHVGRLFVSEKLPLQLQLIVKDAVEAVLLFACCLLFYTTLD